MIELTHLAHANETHLDNLAAKRAERRKNQAVTQASCPSRAHAAPTHAETDALYVTTNLKTWHTNDPSGIARDVGLNGACYRRLDPIYYAWLHGQMAKLKQASDAGKLSAGQVDASLAAFRDIHDWASARFGRAELAEAVKNFRPRANLYKPPSMDWLIRSGFETAPEEQENAAAQRTRQAYLYPPDSEVPEEDLPFWAKIPEGTVEKVRAIENQALALGWTRASLYQNRGIFKFPMGPGYGLACFVKAKDEIGRVTCKTVEIIKPAPSRSVLRFHAEHSKKAANPQKKPLTQAPQEEAGPVII